MADEKTVKMIDIDLNTKYWPASATSDNDAIGPGKVALPVDEAREVVKKGLGTAII